MSFTIDIKNELCECIIPQPMLDILRYGLLYCLSSDKSFLLTDSRCVDMSFAELFGNDVCSEQVKRKNGQYYKISVSENALEPKFGYKEAEINRNYVSGNDTETGIFLRGVFLACGMVSVQKAGYHLELSVRDAKKCEQLYNLIHEQGMKINRSVRRGIPFLYSKDSENIADFLTFIGAMSGSMEIMNIKIYKEFRSNINRVVNCEAANIGKTVTAAAKQIEDIRLIMESGEYDKLSSELKEIASLRIDNPDISLNDLGKLLDPPISRSGVNHRLERLKRIAEELRESKS